MMSFDRRKFTPSQRKFLKKMREMPGAPIVEIAREAAVPPNTYYRMLEKQDFREILPNVINDLLAAQLLPVLQSVTGRALAGSSRHAELLLKVAKLVGGDREIKILQVLGGERQGETRLMTDKEIADLLTLSKGDNNDE